MKNLKSDTPKANTVPFLLAIVAFATVFGGLGSLIGIVLGLEAGSVIVVGILAFGPALIGARVQKAFCEVESILEKVFN